MSCDHFTRILPDFLEGKLDADGRASAEAHLRDCDSCRRLLAVVRGKISVLPAGTGRDLARSIIEHTTGSTCARAEERLCDFVDGDLDEESRQLVAFHLDFCSACRTVADDLAAMKEALPQMAEIEPGGNFIREVVGMTSEWRPFRPSLRTRVLAWWSRLIQRPRFSFEAAYVGTLILVFAFINPILPLRNIAAERLGSGTIRAVAWERVSSILPSGWVDSNAPALRFARSLAAGASQQEQAISSSLSDMMKRCAQMLASALEGRVQNIDRWRQEASGAFRRIWSDLSSRIPRAKS